MRHLYICLSLCALLSGCLMGPNYHPPETIICDTWSSDPSETNSCASPYEDPPIAWWQIFNDPLLNKYIEMAALNNSDVLIAEANIWQARAVRQVTASDLFPHVSADLNALRTYFSKNGFFELFSQTMRSVGSSMEPQIPILNLYDALLAVTWEIDLFGKTRRSIEAANANIGGAIEQRNAILISILAEVAINYMELRSNQKMGFLIENNISLLEQNVSIVTKQVQAGYKNRLDLERVEAELAQDRANLPDIYAQIYQNIYAISILTGNPPEMLLQELLPIQPLPIPPQQITVGIRSDLLRRRPDVRQAERQLAAATANIGVAVASFFPSFSLIGAIGLQSLHLHNLLQAQSLTWALDGNISIPIYQGGKLVGNLRSSEAQACAAALNYQKIVLTALQEAESALISYSEELHKTELLTEAVADYESLIFLTNERYAKGLVSVTDLLDVERQWNTAEQNLLTSETDALVDLIILYKALGGGWEPADAYL